MFCTKCLPTMAKIKMRKFCGAMTYRCAGCQMAMIEQEAFVPRQDTYLVCAACKKVVKVRRARACKWCFDVVACSDECWAKIAADHLKTCECVGSDVCEMLGIAECDVGTAIPEGCDAVGAKSRGGGGGSGMGRSKYSTGHWHRHPNISPQKARFILHEGKIRGHPLTGRQQRLFGFLSSRKHY